MTDKELREPLADVSHDIWSHWMRWMFTTGTHNEDGTWTMPAALVERWHRQMNTPYADLSEREKESDREQADKILAVRRECIMSQPPVNMPTDEQRESRLTNALHFLTLLLIEDNLTPVRVLELETIYKKRSKGLGDDFHIGQTWQFGFMLLDFDAHNRRVRDVLDALDSAMTGMY